MTEKIPLIILSSARKQSDTRAFVEFTFNKNECNIIDLLDHVVSPYNYDNNYPDSDSFLKIIEEILKHDTVVFATPVYWYSMSAYLKTFFDRLTDLLTTQKQIGRQLKGKSVFLIAIGTDSKLPDGFEIPFKLTSEYFEMNYVCSAYFQSNIDKINMLNAKNNFIDLIKASNA